MVTVIATLKVKPGNEAKLEQGVRDMIAYVKAHEPGTLTYLLHRASGDPTEFMIYEVYADQAAFATHGGSEQMQKFFGLAGGLLDGRPDIKMYETIDGKR